MDKAKEKFADRLARYKMETIVSLLNEKAQVEARLAKIDKEIEKVDKITYLPTTGSTCSTTYPFADEVGSGRCIIGR